MHHSYVKEASIPAQDGRSLIARYRVGDGELYSWGYNTWGQLGHDPEITSECILLPTVVPPMQSPAGALLRIIKVACGGSHTVVLAEDNSVWSWGRGANGRLGLGSTSDCCRPQRVADLASQVVVSVSCGFSHTVISTGMSVPHHLIAVAVAVASRMLMSVCGTSREQPGVFVRKGRRRSAGPSGTRGSTATSIDRVLCNESGPGAADRLGLLSFGHVDSYDIK